MAGVIKTLETYSGLIVSGSVVKATVDTADITADAVTYAKMQNVSAASRLLGRGGASGSGDVQEIALGSGLTMTGTTLSASTSYTDEEAQDAVGAILVDSATIDFTYADATPSITAAVIDNSVTDAKLRQSAGMSVIGRSANSTGDVTDITAGPDGHVLRRDGPAIVFNTLTTICFDNNCVTYAKLQDVTDARLLGRSAGVDGDCQEITVGTGLSLSGGSLTCTVTATGTVTSVALAVPGFLSVSGSPVTTSGTLTIALATQSANVVFAGPSSGSAANPTFRSLVPKDTTAKGARVKHSTNQSISGITVTALNFDTEDSDTDAYHDTVTNNTRLTVPTGMGGLYTVGGCVNWANNTTGVRRIAIKLNGTTIKAQDERQAATGTNTTTNTVSTLLTLAAADYVELVVYQDSGGNLNAVAGVDYAPVFWLALLGA